MGLHIIATSHVHEFLTGALIHFNIPGAHMVFVPSKSHVPVGLINKTNEGFAVTSTLTAQTQRNTSPLKKKTSYFYYKIMLSFNLLFNIETSEKFGNVTVR